MNISHLKQGLLYCLFRVSELFLQKSTCCLQLYRGDNSSNGQSNK
ncbi:hypothetical protein JN06_01464 [Bacteroides zoogleoformans]|nr:hypothetical protein JN06_01464 [Bacteroides zoogleoformans]